MRRSPKIRMDVSKVPLVLWISALNLTWHCFLNTQCSQKYSSPIFYPLSKSSLLNIVNTLSFICLIYICHNLVVFKIDFEVKNAIAPIIVLPCVKNINFSSLSSEQERPLKSLKLHLQPYIYVSLRVKCPQRNQNFLQL